MGRDAVNTGEPPQRGRLGTLTTILGGLSRSETLARSGLQAALQEVLREGARGLGVTRAGVWFFSGPVLRCAALLVDGVVTDGEGITFHEADAPRYFAALRESRVIAAEDAQHEPHTADFAASYLVPNGIGAMIDAPIRVFGELVGTLCHEHIGPPRAWSEEERAFAGALGDLVALAVTSSRHQAAARNAEANEAKYRALVESMPGAVYSFSLSHGEAAEYVSPYVRVISGHEPAYWTHPDGLQRWLRAVHPEDRARVRARIVAGVHEHELSECEYRFLHADGSLRWFRDVIRAVRGPGGELIGAQGILQDITEQAQAHRAQQEAEQRFRDLIERGAFLAVSLDEEGRVLFLNEALSELLALRPEDAIGQDWFSLALPIEARAEARSFLLGPEVALACDLPLQTPTGPLTIHWTNSPLRHTNDAPAGVACLGVDLTARLRLEQRLRDAAHDEGVARLAAGAAHDLNNILASINGVVGSIQDLTPATGEIADGLGELLRFVSRAGEFSRKLLRFARRLPAVPRQVELDPLLLDATELARMVLSSSIPLEVSLGTAGERVQLDPTQLHQVIVNVAANARDAMPMGGKTWLSSEVLRLDAPSAAALGGLKPGRYARVVFRDAGPGMPPHDVQRAFEPFFTTKGERGTGLGLAVCYGILRQAGGHILLDSTLGTGTQVSLYLPLVEAPRAASSAALDPALGVHVLLVDDDAFVREALSEGLRERGYTVITASSAAAARALVAERGERFLALVADLLMPGGGGLALGQELRARFPGLRTLLISGGAPPVLRHEGVHFLQKPFSTDELAQALRGLGVVPG